MQLTTPEVKEYDTVFPGENWFFYWRTSPSLWETKLREYQGSSPIFVPIYWGLHSEHPDQFDFGQYRPEADLKRLFTLAKSLGRELTIVLPTTPSPFLPSGGVPAYLARTIMMSEEGMGVSIVDSEGRLNKLFSFYDPRTFQSFRKFTYHLGQFLTQSGFNCEVFGADFGYLSNGLYKSYFDDKSIAFEQGFNRYLKQIEITEPEKIEQLKENHHLEETLKVDYAILIKNLYTDSAVEAIPANWAGVLKFAHLGGAPEDIFARTNDMWEHHGDFFKPFFNILVNDLLPSSVLLSPGLKKGVLQKALKDIVSSSLITSHLDNSLYEDDLVTSFNPLIFFNIYVGDTSQQKNLEFLLNGGGLRYYFDREYHWMYRISHSSFRYKPDFDQEERIHFFFGSLLTLEDFNHVLRLFMNGGKIFIDIDGLDEEISKKLSVFLTENSIDTEKINFMTPIVKAQLGEGLIITYDNKKLSEVGLMKKIGFWETMIKFLKLNNLKVQIDEGLYYMWKHRSSNTYELNYEEIRRVSLYNPTSYKKKSTILSSKNYAFLKTVDEINAQVKSTPIGVDIDLMPGASISLDFGYFE